MCVYLCMCMRSCCCFFLVFFNVHNYFIFIYHAKGRNAMYETEIKEKKKKEKRESFTPAWVLNPRWTPSQVEPRALSQHGPWKI